MTRRAPARGSRLSARFSIGSNNRNANANCNVNANDKGNANAKANGNATFRACVGVHWTLFSFAVPLTYRLRWGEGGARLVALL